MEMLTMNAKTLLTCIAGIFLLAIGAAIAQQDVPDVIEFGGATDGGGSGDIFRSIYSGPVKFTHLKHVEDYGAVCGDCHHDSDAEPIASFDPDATYACGECHDEEGLIRGPIAENEIPESDRIAYRANALHLQCIGCHKKYNELNKVVRVPESCITCHARKPQDWVVK
jgi:hypothetical protein